MLGYDWPRLHAALNDLPTALLLTAVFFDVVAMVSRRPLFRQMGFWTMVVGAVGAVAAVISGLQAEEHIAHGEAVHRVMGTHERLAFVTLGIFGVVVLWRIVREKRMAAIERLLTVILSLGGVGVLFATARFGGKLVFEHAAGIRSEVLESELHERAEGHHHDGETEEPMTSPDSSTGQQQSSDHIDPPGISPHTHSHPPGTPPHRD